MNITTLEKCLPYILEAKVTAWLHGYHGRGKTEFIENFCKKRDWLCFNFRLGTQCDVGDILGLADFIENEQGQRIATAFFKPDWLHKAITFCEQNPDKKAIVFFDELNRVFRQDLIPPVFQMALDHRLHTYEFPSNLHIIVAANPDTKDYKVLKFSDKAFFDRFCHIKFNPSIEEWFSYVRNNGWHNDIIGFLQEQPEFIENDSLEDFEVSQYIERSRRSWGLVKRLIDINTPSDILMEIASGIIEAKTVVAWKDYIAKQGKPITATDVVNNYNKGDVRERVLKYADMNSANNRMDLLKYTCDALVDFFKNNKDDFNQEQSNNICRYLKDIPGEITYDFCQLAGRYLNFIKAINDDDDLLNMIDEAKKLAKLKK
jgi:hypothetical protein